MSLVSIICYCLQKVPAAVAVSSHQYERALADLVIMLAPFAPMFASELWAGLYSVKNETTSSDLNTVFASIHSIGKVHSG